MGTLYNQPPRGETIKAYVNTVMEAARALADDEEKGHATPDQWLAAAAAVKAALDLQNADAFDEQLAGLADIADRFVGALERIAEALEKK